jgi:ferrochelatase
MQALSLEPDRCTTSFQSRLGPTRWIGPYTDVVLDDLRARGITRLAVMCPAFVADCLETLEEIGLRLRARWEAIGGEAFGLVPCVNAEPGWAEAVARLVRDAAGAPAAPPDEAGAVRPADATGPAPPR